MRIAISNIAWNVADDEAVAHLLQRHRVDCIDIAPGKYFSEILSGADFLYDSEPRPSIEAIQKVRAGWTERGISIGGMQSLLFGTQGLNLFAAGDVQRAMLDHLTAVFRIAGHLGARCLVFGSPKNRDRGHLSETAAETVAIDFFRALGERAGEHGVIVCLEANPERYGCNFMTTTDSAAYMVRRIDHPAIRLHLDTGTLLINGESAADTVRKHADLIAHVHASLPDLRPLGKSTREQDERQREIALALAQYRPDLTVSIEMLIPPDSSSLDTVDIIDKALAKACALYRDGCADGRGNAAVAVAAKKPSESTPS